MSVKLCLRKANDSILSRFIGYTYQLQTVTVTNKQGRVYIRFETSFLLCAFIKEKYEKKKQDIRCGTHAGRSSPQYL